MSADKTKIKITGFGRFSPRLYWLARIANGDDPVMSVIARRMITDPTARKIGGWFEFITVGFTPLLLFEYMLVAELSAWTVIGMRIRSSYFPVLHPFEEIVLGTLMICTLLFLLFLLIVALWPGHYLRSMDLQGEVLRGITLSDYEILRKLLLIQFGSILLPVIIGEIFALGFAIWESSGFDPSLAPVAGISLVRSPSEAMLALIIRVIFTCAIGLIGIMASMKTREFWKAFGLYMILCLVCSIVVVFFIAVIAPLLASVFAFNSVLYGIAYVVISGIFSTWVLYVIFGFTKAEIKKAKMPEK